MRVDGDLFESENVHGSASSEQEGTHAGSGKPLMQMSENGIRT